MFLKSDDAVAVRVRQRLGNDALLDVATELEKCLSIPDKNEQISAIKKGFSWWCNAWSDKSRFRKCSGSTRITGFGRKFIS